MSSPQRFDHHKLSNRILFALGAGLAVGLLLNLTVADQAWAEAWLFDGLFGVVGEVFVRLLSMLIVPIVFVSLVTGVSALSDPKSLGRLSGLAILLYMVTTGIAVTLALTFALIVQPGVGAAPAAAAPLDIAQAPPFSQVLIDMVPRNPVQAMAEGNMLPLILFSILLGLSISFAGRQAENVAQFFHSFNVVVMRLVGIVMSVAPFGVFALVANMAATTGWGTFGGVLRYVLLVMVVLVLHAAVVYPTLLRVFTGLSPVVYYRKMRDALTFAFSTASSGATIPVTLRAVQERLGVSNKVSSFTVPLGATINMDGTAIMQGIATVFISQYYGIELSVTQYVMVVAMVIMASVGTAGVPGVGLILLAGVLAQVGLPVEGIALILGVDRLLDMIRTAVNVSGDGVVTTLVARAEGELDEAIYNDPDAGGALAAGPPVRQEA